MGGELGGLNLLFGQMGHRRFSSCPEVGSTHMASVPWYGIKQKDRTRSERSQKPLESGLKPSAITSGADY
jgi:hypothetical protein